MAETTITGALCGVMAAALVEKGVDPALAMALAKRACVPAIGIGVQVTKNKAKRRVGQAKAVNKRLSAAFTEANARLRKNDGQLRSGKTQADVARLAHKLNKKGTTKGQVRKTARRAFER